MEKKTKNVGKTWNCRTTPLELIAECGLHKYWKTVPSPETWRKPGDGIRELTGEKRLFLKIEHSRLDLWTYSIVSIGRRGIEEVRRLQTIINWFKSPPLGKQQSLCMGDISMRLCTFSFPWTPKRSRPFEITTVSHSATSSGWIPLLHIHSLSLIH